MTMQNMTTIEIMGWSLSILTLVLTGCGVVDHTDAGSGELPMDVAQIDSVEPDAFGFDIRVPGQYLIQDYPVSDVDYVCDLIYEQEDLLSDSPGYIYIQATPVSCSFVGCQFETVGAWISFDGVVEPLVAAVYNPGGQHGIDFLDIRIGDLTFRYNHSSIGFGWRPCHTPDCLQVIMNDAMLVDGCQPDRSLPAVCRLVKPDGTFDPLVDDFQRCPGDVAVQ